MSAFTCTPKPNQTKCRTENVYKLDFIFFHLGGRISANTTVNFNYTFTYTTMCIVYNLVNMASIDRLCSETIVLLFYKYKTTDFCGTKPRATIKITD